MSADLQSINTEEEIYKLLETVQDFQERKKIRARLREIHEAEMRMLEQSEEYKPTDLVKMHHELAEKEKQQKLDRFAQRAAERPTCEQEDHELDQSSRDVKARQQLADADKQRKLQRN